MDAKPVRSGLPQFFKPPPTIWSVTLGQGHQDGGTEATRRSKGRIGLSPSPGPLAKVDAEGEEEERGGIEDHVGGDRGKDVPGPVEEERKQEAEGRQRDEDAQVEVDRTKQDRRPDQRGPGPSSVADRGEEHSAEDDLLHHRSQDASRQVKPCTAERPGCNEQFNRALRGQLDAKASQEPGHEPLESIGGGQEGQAGQDADSERPGRGTPVEPEAELPAHAMSPEKTVDGGQDDRVEEELAGDQAHPFGQPNGSQPSLDQPAQDKRHRHPEEKAQDFLDGPWGAGRHGPSLRPEWRPGKGFASGPGFGLGEGLQASSTVLRVSGPNQGAVAHFEGALHARGQLLGMCDNEEGDLLLAVQLDEQGADLAGGDAV